MEIKIILTILICHFVFDFIMQDEQWAINKSKSWSALLNHTALYSMLWYAPILFVFREGKDLNGWFLLFPIITFITHTTIDYVTSRITSEMFKKGVYGTPIPNVGGFSVIGFDQLLHYIQLIYTYKILSEL